MPVDQMEKPRKVSRDLVVSKPRRWKISVIVTDSPDAGETYLTKEQVVEEFAKSITSLPEGLTCEATQQADQLPQ